MKPHELLFVACVVAVVIFGGTTIAQEIPSVTTPPPSEVEDAPVAAPEPAPAPVAAPQPPPPPISIEAQIAAQTAVQAAKARLWDEALKSASKAIALEPTWGHAYFVRAGVHIGLAGAQTELRRLSADAIDLEFDYAAALERIDAALNDLQAFDHFETDPVRRREVVEVVAQLRVRAAALRDFLPRVDEFRKAEAERAKGKVQNADTAGNWCWPGQVWSDGRCVGVPSSCPDGYKPDAQNQSCELKACEPGKVRTSGTQCCWPGQGWSSERNRCVGIPQCPPSFTTRADLKLDESCVKEVTVSLHPEPRVASRGCKETLKLRRNSVFVFTIDSPEAVALLGGGADARKQLTAAEAANRGCAYYGDDASRSAALWCCPSPAR